MEPFTVVLVGGWLLLVATFVTMYILDQKVREATQRSNQSQENANSR